MEASSKTFPPGAAMGKRVRVRLEDHEVTRPFGGVMIDYLADQDLKGKGWYLASLDSPVPVFSEPVKEVLLFANGAVERSIANRPTHDKDGRQISYQYKYPLEEMLLNSNSDIKYLLANIAIIRDPTILREKRLSHDQLQIYQYATVWRTRWYGR
jgi:hypothetical protein